MSGRSEPKRLIASAWVIRGYGPAPTGKSVTANTAAITASIISSTSSSSTNPISMSSWVNSNMRSARESSSRKQRTIW